jgi:hypothetical protein
LASLAAIGQFWPLFVLDSTRRERPAIAARLVARPALEVDALLWRFLGRLVVASLGIRWLRRLCLGRFGLWRRVAGAVKGSLDRLAPALRPVLAAFYITVRLFRRLRPQRVRLVGRVLVDGDFLGLRRRLGRSRRRRIGRIGHGLGSFLICSRV